MGNIGEKISRHNENLQAAMDEFFVNLPVNGSVETKPAAEPELEPDSEMIDVKPQQTPEEIEKAWMERLDKIEKVADEEHIRLTALSEQLEKDVMEFNTGWYSFNRSKVWAVTTITFVGILGTRVASTIERLDINHDVNTICFAAEWAFSILEGIGIVWAAKISFDANTSAELKSIQQEGLQRSAYFKEMIKDYKDIRKEAENQRLKQQVLEKSQEEQEAYHDLLQKAEEERAKLDEKISRCLFNLEKVSNSYPDSSKSPAKPGAQINLEEAKDKLISDFIHLLPSDDPIKIEMQNLEEPGTKPVVETNPDLDLSARRFTLYQSRDQALRSTMNASDRTPDNDIGLESPNFLLQDDPTPVRDMETVEGDSRSRLVGVSRMVAKTARAFHNRSPNHSEDHELLEIQVEDNSHFREYQTNLGLLKLRLIKRWGLKSNANCFYGKNHLCTPEGLIPITAAIPLSA